VLHEGRIASKKAMKGDPYRVVQNRKKIKKAQNHIERFQTELPNIESNSGKQKLLDKIEEKIKQIDGFGEKMREAYVNMILANIYKIVEVYSVHNPEKPSRGWDHIGIGSDFDGMINKMDYLSTANEFPELNELIVKFLKTPQPLIEFNQSWTTERLKALQFNFSAEELADKIMSQNADSFLQKYFNVDYLINGIQPASVTREQLIA
jgi:dsDNA-specific endonuclease/ATPase MutS2